MVDRKRTRYKQFILRATPDEEKKIRRMITKSRKKTFQKFALDLLLNGKILSVDYSGLSELSKEVNAIGTNINQLTKYANQFNDLDRELLLALKDEVDDLRNLILSEFETKEFRKVEWIDGRDESCSD